MDFQELFQQERINFGVKLLEIATFLDISQSALGIRCDINRTEINRIINGKKNLELETIIKVANGISTQTKYLFDYTHKFSLAFINEKQNLAIRTRTEKKLLGDRLIHIRKRRNLIQLDVDLESGIWGSDISRMENAMSNTKHYSLFRLASVFHITTYDLFDFGNDNIL